MRKLNDEQVRVLRDFRDANSSWSHPNTLASLERRGLIANLGYHGGTEGNYFITDAGRETLAKLGVSEQ